MIKDAGKRPIGDLVESFVGDGIACTFFPTEWRRSGWRAPFRNLHGSRAKRISVMEMLIELQTALHGVDDGEEPPRYQCVRDYCRVTTLVRDDFPRYGITGFLPLRANHHRPPEFLVILSPARTYGRNSFGRHRCWRWRWRRWAGIIKIVVSKYFAERTLVIVRRFQESERPRLNFPCGRIYLCS